MELIDIVDMSGIANKPDDVLKNPDTEINLYKGCSKECSQNHPIWYQSNICGHPKKSQGCSSNKRYEEHWRNKIQNVAK